MPTQGDNAGSESPTPTLEFGASSTSGAAGAVPAPVPPDDPRAWYAPTVRSQYEVAPDTVVTISDADHGFDYAVREATLGARETDALETVRDHFSTVVRRRPLTREGAVSRAETGLSPKYRRIFDRLLDLTPTARRRVERHALSELRLLGAVTPLALDDRIEVVDAGRGDGSERLVVHTEDFAPATTTFDSDVSFADRIAAERIDHYTVPFAGYDVDVVIYRDRLLGDDRFATKYAVLEPDLVPGDAELIEECKERIWEANVNDVVADRIEFVRDRAREFLSRRLTARNTRAWVDATSFRVRAALSEYGLALPPVDRRFAEDRLDDLVYYVLRDYVGEGVLTVPIRDPHLEDVEANRVGERIKVIPRADVTGHGGLRVPTNLVFEDETEFTNVVTQLAAADGVELNASNPSAKVNLRPGAVGGDPASADTDETIRCAVALPVISEGGPHVSIRKQTGDVLTPVDLVESGSVSTELVTLLWLCYEHHRVVLFSGATGVGKTTLMNAHMPFVPYDHRPISIDEGSREVHLPHETGVSLTTRDHESEFKRVTMADLMTEANYLNPDVEVIAEINTPESFATFAETLNTGHGVIGTTHAADIETLVNRVIEQGLPPYLLRELDLVVFPHKVDGERYVSEVVELVPESEYDETWGRRGVIEKDGRTLHWNTVGRRTPDGSFDLSYEHPQLGDDHRRVGVRLFHRIAEATDRDVEAVEREFHRKHRYVEYLVREQITDVDRLFGFLSDLRTDEAATVERVRRRMAERDSADGDSAARGGVDDHTHHRDRDDEADP
ncbi:secretion system protein [Haloferax sp. Atlit-47N]|uniref:Type IV pilus biogenesis complex ATPase subunit n=5 Tax=Haloferacaceae TaxID=1644056 RepID=D4GSL6_HALVD|nr:MULTISPECIES: type II/IV secretion system ATPase subunit [Haloferax]ADE04310.1 type IV pilus biogenesis complex ATPase subunit [Haloferax volcanii DS2]ELK52850.1 type IV pilus biogenesis complex ATPase subunit [Haloferax sp. BAB-2207]ELY26120.1 type IV pilus biogenesis complex ATPase subunit [Haloferax volcanii DS2]ELZ71037.1 type IV pilus biogenesis complex ATPase subunit [Haloferax lucentense DSM 14919]MBS8119826.1 type II/IV secretion system ATPase subunit [Haloferax volcanii]